MPSLICRQFIPWSETPLQRAASVLLPRAGMLATATPGRLPWQRFADPSALPPAGGARHAACPGAAHRGGAAAAARSGSLPPAAGLPRMAACRQRQLAASGRLP